MPASDRKDTDLKDGDQRTFRAMMAQAARYSEIAFIIPAGMVAGYLLGLLFDHWFHAKWLVIAGVVIGVIAGFVEMIRRVVALSR